MSDSERERERMVSVQIAGRGVRDRRVLAAMAAVPRDLFVPPERREAAYQDRALPLALGQTISQPYMVARAVELARVGPSAKVLDVGTGSGYQAAVLAELAERVVTIERIDVLAEIARATLERLGYASKVQVVVGDGSMGLAQHAPYDAIVAAAAAPRAPEALKQQLAIGGRLVLPIGARGHQRLTAIERRGEAEWIETEHEPCVYVPLVGRGGFAHE